MPVLGRIEELDGTTPGMVSPRSATGGGDRRTRVRRARTGGRPGRARWSGRRRRGACEHQPGKEHARPECGAQTTEQPSPSRAVTRTGEPSQPEPAGQIGHVAPPRQTDPQGSFHGLLRQTMTHTLEHGSVGHASPTTALRDQRAIEDRHRAIAEALDQLSQAARIPVDSGSARDPSRPRRARSRRGETSHPF